MAFKFTTGVTRIKCKDALVAAIVIAVLLFLGQLMSLGRSGQNEKLTQKTENEANNQQEGQRLWLNGPHPTRHLY